MLPVLLMSVLAQAPQAPAFKSSSELVVLHVAVVDRRAGFVAGLPREAFSVYEDHRPQQIAFFQNDDTPVSVGLVIDGSQSMVSRLPGVVEAGMTFAESSRADDEMFTINFNEHVRRGLPANQLFTSDHEELRQALNRSGARGMTALYDAIDAGLKQLDQGTKDRKVLIVVSDGGDNASTTRFADVLDQALRRDVVIYAVGIYDDNDGDAKPDVLRQLAAATGGEVFFPRTFDQVAPALQRIARDIRSSYTIGYVPPKDGDPSGHKHTIRVAVQPTDGRKLAVRARSAYIGGTEVTGASR